MGLQSTSTEIQIVFKGVERNDQVFVLDKTVENLFQINKFIEFCKSSKNSSHSKFKTPLDVFKTLQKPLELDNFSDPLFVPHKPNSILFPTTFNPPILPDTQTSPNTSLLIPQNQNSTIPTTFNPPIPSVTQTSPSTLTLLTP